LELDMTQSPDPWTTRARPTFLYVIYVMILWAIPMSIIAAFFPGVAQHMTAGIAAYLAAIPESVWALFGTGYLGYTAARSWGKAKGVEK
jgi:Holin of 3TMs, for gene-transfer release